MGTLRRTCATVPQPSELQFGVVRAVGRGIAVLHGVHVVQGQGGLGVFVLHFHNGKCHWIADSEMFPIPVRKQTSQHFRSANVSSESSIRGLFDDVFGFNINVGVYEKLADKERLFCQNSTASSKLLLPVLR